MRNRREGGMGVRHEKRTRYTGLVWRCPHKHRISQWALVAAGACRPNPQRRWAKRKKQKRQRQPRPQTTSTTTNDLKRRRMERVLRRGPVGYRAILRHSRQSSNQERMAAALTDARVPSSCSTPAGGMPTPQGRGCKSKV
jgi:hypothetical protein